MSRHLLADGCTMRNSVSHSLRRFDSVFSLAPLCVAVALGTVLGRLVLAIAPAMPGWSRYKLVLFLLMGLVYLGMLVIGDVRRVWLVCLALAIPLNLAFAPLGKEVAYHAGGASAGVTLYPYDFPLIALLALSLLDTLAKRKPIQFSIIDVAAILLIIWTALSIYNSSDIRLSVFELLRVTKLYLLARVVAGNVKRRQDMQDVLMALLIGLILQSVIAALQNTIGLDLGLGTFTVGELNRVSGTVGWPNTFGAYAATILSVGVALWLFAVGGKFGILVMAACGAGFVSLILSFSRGAWTSLLAGVVIILFLGWRAARINTRSLAKLTAIALSAAMVGMLFGSSIVTRLTEVHPGMDTLVDRMKLNQVALNMIAAQPLLGVGINTFVDVMRQYDTTGVTYYFPQPVHNVYLLVAAETGLVGLGLFLLLMLMTFREGVQAAKTDDRFLSACAIAILSGLVVLAVNNLADVHLRTDVLYALFWLLIGLAAAVKRMTRATFGGYDENVVTRSEVGSGHQPHSSPSARQLTGGEATRL